MAEERDGGRAGRQPLRSLPLAIIALAAVAASTADEVVEHEEEGEGEHGHVGLIHGCGAGDVVAEADEL